jgi:hypothetical protein
MSEARAVLSYFGGGFAIFLDPLGGGLRGDEIEPDHLSRGAKWRDDRN